MDSQSLGRRLRGWRNRHRVPLKAIALSIGVSEGTVSRWESGTRFPSQEKLDALATFLGVPLCALFCRQVDECGHFDFPIGE